MNKKQQTTCLLVAACISFVLCGCYNRDDNPCYKVFYSVSLGSPYFVRGEDGVTYNEVRSFSTLEDATAYVTCESVCNTNLSASTFRIEKVEIWHERIEREEVYQKPVAARK
jgi:uncharacterized lipoprotein NlpE involved in copper resistance